MPSARARTTMPRCIDHRPAGLAGPGGDRRPLGSPFARGAQLSPGGTQRSGAGSLATLTAAAFGVRLLASWAAWRPWCGAEARTFFLPTRSRPAPAVAGANKSTELAKAPCWCHDPTPKKRRPAQGGPPEPQNGMPDPHLSTPPQAETRSALIVLR